MLKLSPGLERGGSCISLKSFIVYYLNPHSPHQLYHPLRVPPGARTKGGKAKYPSPRLVFYFQYDKKILNNVMHFLHIYSSPSTAASTRNSTKPSARVLHSSIFS